MNATFIVYLRLFNIYDHFLVAQMAFCEDFSGFVEQNLLVFVACAVMPQKKLPDLGIAGHHRRLFRRCVEVFFGVVKLVVGVSAFVVEHVHVFHDLMKRRHIAGIAAIGVTARWFGRSHEAAVGDDFPVFSRPVGTVFNVVDLADGNLVEVYHLSADVGQRRLFTEKIAAAGHAMLQRNRLDRQAFVFVNDCLFCGIDGVEFDFVFEVVAKHFELRPQHLLELGRRENPQRLCATEQSESADHSNHSKAMVAVQVREKNGGKSCEGDVRTSQGDLRALAAVNHKEFAANLDDLRTRVVLQRRQSTSAAQNMHLERLHTPLLHPFIDENSVAILEIEAVGTEIDDVERVGVEQ